jgi:hypothetical protein
MNKRSQANGTSTVQPLFAAGPPKGERGIYFLCALVAAFFSFASPAWAQQAYSVSIKAPDLDKQERVAGFWIEVSGGSIRSVLSLPPGWVINIDNLAGHTSIQGTLQEGAAAMDPAFFRDFMRVEEDAHPIAIFALQGELILTGDPLDSAYDGRHVPLIRDQFELKPVP